MRAEVEVVVRYLEQLSEGDLWRALHRLAIFWVDRPREVDGRWQGTARLGVRHQFHEQFVGQSKQEVLAKGLAHGLDALVATLRSVRDDLGYVLPDLGLYLERGVRERIVPPPQTLPPAID